MDFISHSFAPICLSGNLLFDLLIRNRIFHASDQELNFQLTNKLPKQIAGYGVQSILSIIDLVVNKFGR